MIPKLSMSLALVVYRHFVGFNVSDNGSSACMPIAIYKFINTHACIDIINVILQYQT